MEDIQIFYYGEAGACKELSPAQVNAQSYATSFLYQIATHKPFELSKYDLAQKLNLDVKLVESRLRALERVGEISNRGGSYRLNFPVFLERDVQKINVLLSEKIQEIGRKVICLLDIIRPYLDKLNCGKIFGERRLLYHILCDYVFDGEAFAYLEKKSLVATSRTDYDGWDCLSIGFECSRFVAGNSNGLLCSSNNFVTEKVVYNSFGDSAGLRKDMFRSSKSLHTADGDALLHFSPGMNDFLRNSKWENIVEKCDRLIERIALSEKPVLFSRENRKIVMFLSELGYVTRPALGNQVHIKVPVFFKQENQLLKEVAKAVMEDIIELVDQTMEEMFNRIPELTSLMHHVDRKEIGNELWHQIFGKVNQHLVEQRIVEKPIYRISEGRFLQCIRLR